MSLHAGNHYSIKGSQTGRRRLTWIFSYVLEKRVAKFFARVVKHPRNVKKSINECRIGYDRLLQYADEEYHAWIKDGLIPCVLADYRKCAVLRNYTYFCSRSGFILNSWLLCGIRDLCLFKLLSFVVCIFGRLKYEQKMLKR